MSKKEIEICDNTPTHTATTDVQGRIVITSTWDINSELTVLHTVDL